jgi:16S rRNA processing protein RimM
MTSDILLGVIIGAQGLAGEVRVKTFTEAPESGRAFEIVATRTAKSGIAIVRFKGVEDRSAAEALADTKLFVSRGVLPATENDEFYHADLVGLRAQDNEGRVIGEIHAVHNFGAGDVIEILRTDGSTLLIPFTTDFVPQIRLGDKYVVVSEPIDIEAEEERGIE